MMTLSTAGGPAPRGTVASIGRRVAAYAIDAAIAGGVLIVTLVVTGLVVRFIMNPADLETLTAGIFLLYGAALVTSLAWMFVYTAMQGGAGSIGQRALKLQLVDATTGAARIGFGRALLRNIVWGLTTAIAIGYFTPLFDSARRQGWHDMAGRAVMVDRVAVTGAVARTAAAASSAPVAAASPNPFLVPGDAVHATFPTIPAASIADLMHTDPDGAVEDLQSFAAPAAPAPGAAQPASSAPAPALPVASTGIISEVPGKTAGAASFAAPVAAPAAPIAPPVVAPAVSPVVAPAAAPPAAAAAPAMVAEDLDATRAAASVPAPRTPTTLALVWDDGTRTAIHGPTVFGRNPAAEAGAMAVPVRDETLSLSKTHFEAATDAEGTWITDRHSTNGTVLHRAGAALPLEPGERTRLQAGDRVEIGDRSLRVEAIA